MKRATITFPDALEKKLAAYLAEQRTPPSLSTVVQVALEEYLENQKWAKYEVRLASGPLELTVADEGDFIGEVDDVSKNLERDLAEDLYERKVARVQGEPKDAREKEPTR